MKVDNEYLPFLFEGDYLYVVKEEGQTTEYEVPADDKKPEVAEPDPQVNAPVKDTVLATKPVLVLVDDEFTETEQDTLQKLLTAIQVKEQHYQIIKEHPENLKSLNNLKLFLSFHKDFIKEEQYQIHMLNATRVIYAHNLNELNRDTQKKVQLWNLLKTIVK